MEENKLEQNLKTLNESISALNKSINTLTDSINRLHTSELESVNFTPISQTLEKLNINLVKLLNKSEG